MLVPFTGGNLDQTVLNAAIRIAHADDATLVPAYLILVPIESAETRPRTATWRSLCPSSRRSSTPR